LAFAYAYAKAFSGEAGLVLAVDEPESNLHPVAQQWLAQKLHELSTDGLQVVVTTHSPHFVDLARPENLVLVKKVSPDEGTKVVQVSREDLAAKLVEMGANAEKTNAETIGHFYSAAATSDIKTGLFSRGCILVEGDTERLGLPGLLRLYDYDPLHDGVAIIPVGGVSNLAKWYRLFTVLGIPVYPILDTDSDKTGKTGKERERDRRDLMVALGLDPELAVNLSGKPIYLHDQFTALDANFESSMVQLFPQRWDELVEESREFVGDSKSLQARYVTERLSKSDAVDEFAGLLGALVAKLRGALAGTGASLDVKAAPELAMAYASVGELPPL
jgi:putative ATP-dependent endonuclease of OLD family